VELALWCRRVEDHDGVSVPSRPRRCAGATSGWRGGRVEVGDESWPEMCQRLCDRVPADPGRCVRHLVDRFRMWPERRGGENVGRISKPDLETSYRAVEVEPSEDRM
jgi:hypothetical protein